MSFTDDRNFQGSRTRDATATVEARPDESDDQNVICTATLTVKRYVGPSNRFFGFDDWLAKGKIEPASFAHYDAQ